MIERDELAEPIVPPVEEQALLLARVLNITQSHNGPAFLPLISWGLQRGFLIKSATARGGATVSVSEDTLAEITKAARDYAKRMEKESMAEMRTEAAMDPLTLTGWYWVFVEQWYWVFVQQE